MCGFAGEFLFDAARADVAVTDRMAETLRHRGPDASASFLSPDGRCAISFRRLAIIDPQGSHQPLSSPDGNLTVAFNGEIYNFPRLRARLRAEGVCLRTAGDTEALLHLYTKHGQDLPTHLAGMFAFALYDARRPRLLLCRDPLGQKPLLYIQLPDRLVFASEAKALFAHPAVSPRWDMLSIQHYLSFGYIPAPRSAWVGIRKLLPASVLVATQSSITTHSYWQPQFSRPAPSPADRLAHLRASLCSAITDAMVSDVPIGALLSGGIDSSILVAVMSQAAGTTGGVRTFTAGFAETSYDEREYARRVAEHCGTDHTEITIEPGDPLACLDAVVDEYDEPFADSSAVPTAMICRAARQHVKVLLAGDGGDEVFGGYDRYRALWISQRLGPAAYLTLRAAGKFASLCRPRSYRSRMGRLARFSSALPLPPAMQYLYYRSIFTPAELLGLLRPGAAKQMETGAPAEWFCRLYEEAEAPDEVARAQRHDLLTYLPDDLLVKTDRASMACSLELRAPFLERPVVEVGLSLPVELKVNRRRGKLALRQAFADMLPRDILTRPKRGFGVPLADWLRDSLRTVMLDSLTDPRFLEQAGLRAPAVNALIDDHLSRRFDHGHRLWALLVLARWMARQG